MVMKKINNGKKMLILMKIKKISKDKMTKMKNGKTKKMKNKEILFNNKKMNNKSRVKMTTHMKG